MNQEDVIRWDLGSFQSHVYILPISKFHEERMKTCGDMLLTYSNIGC